GAEHIAVNGDKVETALNDRPKYAARPTSPVAAQTPGAIRASPQVPPLGRPNHRALCSEKLPDPRGALRRPSSLRRRKSAVRGPFADESHRRHVFSWVDQRSIPQTAMTSPAPA